MTVSKTFFAKVKRAFIQRLRTLIAAVVTVKVGQKSERPSVVGMVGAKVLFAQEEGSQI
jgi:hypothetical protein